MNKKKENYIVLIWFISIVISVGIGTFVLKLLETTMLNVWIARIIGCIICVITELIFYYLWIKKNKK